MGRLILLLLGLFPSLVWAQASLRVEQSVVRITNYQQTPDWQEPWRLSPTISNTGSGFLIEGGLILTNAHVVSDSRMLLVNKHSNPEPYIARVYAVAHDSDLALLEVQDPEFQNDLTPLPFGELPQLQSRVRAYGYPQGGQDLSRTEGVVSRIEFGTYVHPGIDAHLLVQTDSAINPGNSGGPVIQDGLVVGVAFQSNLRLNDVGYFIPTPLVRRFLKDIEDGHYDGVPEIGIQTTSLLNRHLRDYLELPEGQEGVIVERVLPGSSADGLLQPGDVLLEVGPRKLDLAGMVPYKGQIVDFFIESEEKQVGDPLPLKIWRSGTLKEVTLSLKPPPFSNELRNSYDRLPEYRIYGGLVFVVLSRNLIQAQKGFPPVLAYEHWFREAEQPGTRRQQVVVVSQVLPLPCNAGYAGLENYVVDEVNGVRITSLAHLDQVLQNLPEEERFLVLTSEWSPTPVILNRQEAEAQEPELFKRYGIPALKRLASSEAS